MNTQQMPVHDGVRRYVDDVRAAMSDLSAEELEELTGGLAADLADHVTDSPGGLTALPTPVAYAAELRAAAGIPAAAREAAGADASWLHDAWSATSRAWARAKAENRWLMGATGLADELRPVGWVVRGLVLAVLVAAVWGLVDSWWWLGALLGVVSVWAGRRRGEAGRSGRVVLAAANVLTVVALLPALWWVAESGRHDQGPGEAAYQSGGLVFDGEAVDNVFLYDAQGNRLVGVRAFDQSGRPLNLASRQVTDEGLTPPPVLDRDGHGWENVLPIALRAGEDPWSSGPESAGETPLWTPPLSLAPLAATSNDVGAQSPAPSGTPSPATPGK